MTGSSHPRAHSHLDAHDATLLGVHLSARVRPFDVVIVVLTLVIAALAAGTMTTIGQLERQPEFAALRALGWPRRALLRVILGQAAVTGVSGGLLGALATALLAIALSAPPAAAVTACAVAALGGLLPLCARWTGRSSRSMADSPVSRPVLSGRARRRLITPPALGRAVPATKPSGRGAG